MNNHLSSQFVQLRPDDPGIIAPCGINCGLCRAYMRDRLPCPGCRGGDEHKGKACLNCQIRNCDQLSSEALPFCGSCAEYPCAVLGHLDERYRRRYSVSVLTNLERIRDAGVIRFLDEEAKRWTCPECGSKLCMHKAECISCGYAWQQSGYEPG